MICHHESNEQITLVYIANKVPRCRDFLFAIPNGGSRKGPREGARFKREGVRAGVPDLFLSCPSKLYHGLFIEMKGKDKKKCRVSKEQKEWISKLVSVGYAARVCYGWEEAYKLICDYLADKVVL